MKQLTLLLISVLIIHTTYCQTSDVSVKLGPEIRELKKKYMGELIGFDNHGLYGQYMNRSLFSLGDPGLVRIGFDLRLKEDHDLDLKIGGEKYNYEGIALTKGGLFLFMNASDKDSKEKTLYSIEVDPVKLVMKGTPRKMKSINYGSGLVIHRGTYDIEVSPDTSQVLVIQHNPYKGAKDDQFGLSVFDQNMEELWSRIVNVNVPDKKTEFYDAYVTNKGVAVVLLKVNRKRSAKGGPNYDYRVYAVSGAQDEIIERTIQLEDKDVGNMKLAVNENGQLFMAGDFYDRKQREMGLFSATLDLQSGEIISESYKSFPQDFLALSANSKRKEKRVKKGKATRITSYRMHDIVVLGNGNFLLLGEQYDVHSKVRNNGRTTTTEYYYEYGNIVVGEFNKNGDVERLASVDKYQYIHEAYNSAGSYAYLIDHGDIYLFFNEDAKHYSGTKREVRKRNFDPRPKKNVITMAKVDKNGKVSYQEIYRLQKADANLSPGTALQVSDKELLVGLQTRGTTRYMSIGLK